MSESCTLRKSYQMLLQGLDRLRCPFLLLIRLYWGWQFFEAGRGKLLHIASVTGFFTDLGIPFPGVNAYVVGITECFGGLLLLVGLFSRLAAIPLTINMIVAFLTAHRDTLATLFEDPEPFLSAKAFLFLMASVLVLLFGPGALSLDSLLCWIRTRRTQRPPK